MKKKDSLTGRGFKKTLDAGYCAYAGCGDVIVPIDDSEIDYECISCGALYKRKGDSFVHINDKNIFSDSSFDKDPIRASGEEESIQILNLVRESQQGLLHVRRYW